MKVNYIKPVCETENVLNAMTIFATSGVTGNGLGWGGEDDGTHEPGVKSDNFWENDDEGWE